MSRKILYVINHIDWFWSHRLPLAKGAQDRGWNVSVAVPQASEDQRLAKHGFAGVDLPRTDSGSTLVTLLKTIVSLRKIIKTNRFECIHAITLKYAFVAGLAAIGVKDIRIIFTIAGLGYLFSGEGVKPKILRAVVGPFLKLALRGTKAQLIFQNPDDQELLIKRGFANPERCHLIRGSGVDLNDFAPHGEEAIQLQPPLVVMPTRLVKDKGVSVFAKCSDILKQRGVKADLQLAGGITDNNPLAYNKLEMDKMVANHNFIWLGRVNDMPKLLAKAAIIAYPSHYREGIPKVLLESCAMAKAIITTDHPGCREAVNDGDNGLLVPVRDALALANAIEKLLMDDDLRKSMGQRSLARARTEFDVCIIVDQTLGVYG